MRARPPRLLERIVEAALPEGLSRDAAAGDLSEEFGRRWAASPARARLWYGAQAAWVARSDGVAAL